jgi:hypothetical protein
MVAPVFQIANTASKIITVVSVSQVSQYLFPVSPNVIGMLKLFLAAFAACVCPRLLHGVADGVVARRARVKHDNSIKVVCPVNCHGLGA